LGCNPATLPGANSVTNGVSAANGCGSAPLSVTNVLATNGCVVSDTFYISAVDGCGNVGSSSVTYTWTANATPLVISGTPTNTYLGCNPAILPSANSVTNGVSAANGCGSAPLSVSNVLATNGCVVSDTFYISAVDGCGNVGSSSVTYTWTANATPLVISGTPTNTYLGCNPATLPSANSVTNGVSAANGCGSAPLSVTNVLATNGCVVSDTFYISAVDGCGNVGSSSVTYTWTANATPLVISGTPTNTYFGCNPATLPSANSVTNGMSAANGVRQRAPERDQRAGDQRLPDHGHVLHFGGGRLRECGIEQRDLHLDGQRDAAGHQRNPDQHVSWAAIRRPCPARIA
jgi:uncharacterized membrane protein